MNSLNTWSSSSFSILSYSFISLFYLQISLHVQSFKSFVNIGTQMTQHSFPCLLSLHHDLSTSVPTVEWKILSIFSHSCPHERIWDQLALYFHIIPCHKPLPFSVVSVTRSKVKIASS